MRKSITVFLLAAFAADARAVTINWSPVGNPGNAANTTGFGIVGYSYNIRTYDVTTRQYVDFLNAKDPTGANPPSLYNDQMGSPQSFVGQITYDGNAPDGN